MMRFVICSNSTSPLLILIDLLSSKTEGHYSLLHRKHLIPRHSDKLMVLSDYTIDTKHIIISLLSDPSVKNKKNFAEGYNVLTGKVDNHPANSKYGEVHTGDAWLPELYRYCQNKTDMPVGLIVFGDKLQHTDLHRALSLTPIIFTLTLFNRAARNDLKFWRPIGYIPNLG
jgi:hypothetical protein